MSDDLIRRSDAIKALKGREGILHDAYTAVAIIRAVPSADRPSAVDLSSVYSTAYKNGYDKGYADAVQGIADELVKQGKHIEADRPQGEWIETADGTMCGNCHKFPYDDGEYHIANWYSDFCPNCGARMRPKLQGTHFDSIIIDECAMKGADDDNA